MKIKPTVVEISSWSPYKKILYKCTNCGADFRIFGNKEKYCHNCGTKVDWNVLLELPEPFHKNNEKEEKKLIKMLNKLQLD